MKQKKMMAALLGAAMVMGSMAGTFTVNAAEEATPLEFWTFTEVHGTFYETMAEKWNEANPDKQVEINVNVMPYDDMHNKLQIALSAGEGTPDFVDIEQGKFSNFTQGEPLLMDLTEVAAPYRDDMVESRFELYSKDGKLYGLPTHVGTTVAFYNTELLEAAGIDYTTIKTWDDFKEAGVKYHEETGAEFGTADTSALWTMNLMMAELEGDYLDADGKLAVNSETVAKAASTLKDMQDAGAIATVPEGNPDKEEAYGAFNNGDYAVAIMPMWQMSRYTNYMPDLEGKIAIAAPPVFDENGTVKSVGGGGTGTSVVAGKENADLAAEFLAYAKLSEEGNIEIWNSLGFDPCNKSIWTNEEVTHNPENVYVKYFVNNPFDVLNEMTDNIGGLASMASPKYASINTEFSTVTLNAIFEEGQDAQEALDMAQDDLINELGE